MKTSDGSAEISSLGRNPLLILVDPAEAVTSITPKTWGPALGLNILLGFAAGWVMALGIHAPQPALTNLIVANSISPILFCVATFVVLTILVVVGAIHLPAFGLVWAIAVNINVVLSLSSFINALLVLVLQPNPSQHHSLMLLPSFAMLVPGDGRLASFLYQLNPFDLWWYALLLLALSRRFRVTTVRAAVVVIVLAGLLSFVGSLA